MKSFLIILSILFSIHSHAVMCFDLFKSENAVILFENPKITYLKTYAPLAYLKILNAKKTIENLDKFEKWYESDRSYGQSWITNRRKWTDHDFSEFPEKYRQTLIEIHKIFYSNKELLAEYYHDLLVEAVTESLKENPQSYIEIINKNKIDRKYLQAVLIRRAQERGLSVDTVYTADIGFFEAIKKGGVIDEYFSGYNIGHGAETHLIQMDLVAPVILKNFSGNIKDFWEFVGGTKTGQSAWSMLFDGFGRDFSNPEFLHSLLNEGFIFSEKHIDRDDYRKNQK